MTQQQEAPPIQFSVKRLALSVALIGASLAAGRWLWFLIWRIEDAGGNLNLDDGLALYRAAIWQLLGLYAAMFVCGFAGIGVILGHGRVAAIMGSVVAILVLILLADTISSIGIPLSRLLGPP
jgi:hypothetical protein